MRGDFEHLLTVALETRPRHQLISETASLMESYSGDASRMLLHDQNPMWNGPLKAFADDIVANHPDYKFLSGLQVGKERSLGVLKSLERLQNDSDKQAVIDFINKHPSFVDNWGLRPTAQNRELLAREIVNNRTELLDDLLGLENRSAESVAETLRSYPRTMDSAATSVPHDSLQWMPKSVDGLPLLGKINPNNVKPELEMIDRLGSLGVDHYNLSRTLGSPLLPESERIPVLQEWEQLARTSKDRELEQLSYKLRKRYEPIYAAKAAGSSW
jgi:hypothetical protein